MHDQDTIEVPLTKGYAAIIDKEDAHLVLPYKWQANVKHPKTGQIYAQRKIDGKITGMHRVIAGAKPGEQVDHRDRDGLNNRRANLRVCTVMQNRQNNPLYSVNPTGLRGVVPAPGRDGVWRASISVDGKYTFLGHYDSPEKAALAYDYACRKLRGEFAVLNFPDRNEPLPERMKDPRKGGRPAKSDWLLSH
jgi:hypothetical protein